jgi:hypothetical protein
MIMNLLRIMFRVRIMFKAVGLLDVWYEYWSIHR